MNQLCANTLSNFFVLSFLLCNWCLQKPKVRARGRRDSFIGVCAERRCHSVISERRPGEPGVRHRRGRGRRRTLLSRVFRVREREGVC